jgi:hypothetical protein
MKLILALMILFAGGFAQADHPATRLNKKFNKAAAGTSKATRATGKAGQSGAKYSMRSNVKGTTPKKMVTPPKSGTPKTASSRIKTGSSPNGQGRLGSRRPIKPDFNQAAAKPSGPQKGSLKKKFNDAANPKPKSQPPKHPPPAPKPKPPSPGKQGF